MLEPMQPYWPDDWFQTTPPPWYVVELGHNGIVNVERADTPMIVNTTELLGDHDGEGK